MTEQKTSPFADLFALIDEAQESWDGEFSPLFVPIGRWCFERRHELRETFIEVTTNA